MEKSIENYEISVNNKKIFDFYKDHPSIDFEHANLLLIEFLDTVFNHVTTDVGTNINSQLLSYMSTNKQELESMKLNISSLKDTMSKMNTDILNNMILQLSSIKREYIEDVRNVISNDNIKSDEKLRMLIETNNTHLLDKTNLLLNDIIPKNQDRSNVQLYSNIQQFHTQINEDMSKMFASVNGDKSIQTFLTSFETKYASMLQTIQQPLFSFFTASEDRITKNIDILKESSLHAQSAQKPILDELGEFLGKYNMSSNKGKYGEQNLCSILTNMFPSAEIQDTTGLKASGDFIVRRLDKPTILFENKEYKANIDKEEIAKFIRDIDTQNVNGVFISQYSGISFKQNYQIDIHKGNILVYVQNCEYSSDRIRIATDIIDSLSIKVQELNIDETNNISKEMLDDINEEYQSFIAQKESLMTCLKDFQKRMNTQIDALKLPALDKYLDSKYAYVKTRNFSCDLCNSFVGSSKQSISAHKRGCKKRVADVSAANIHIGLE